MTTVSRWPAVLAYAGLSAANQMLWLTYTPLTTPAARHYGVSVDAIGWLAEIFPLLYVVLALPCGHLLDRWFRPALAAGAALTAAGAVVRLGGGYGSALTGQVIVAVGQPLVLGAVTKVAGGYLHERDRATGIAVGSGSVFAGMLIALGMGSALTHNVPLLLDIGAAFSVVTAVGLLVALRLPVAEIVRDDHPLRSVWGDPVIRTLCGLLFVGFGVFIALTTWLQTLLEPSGISAGTAGALLVAVVIAGVIACTLVPGWLDRGGRPQSLLRLTVGAATVGCAVLALTARLPVDAVVLPVMGGLLLAALPVVLAVADRRAGAAAGTAATLLWLSGNAGGIVVSLAVQAIVGSPAYAFGVLAVIAVAALPLTRSRALAVPVGAPGPQPAPRSMSGSR